MRVSRLLRSVRRSRPRSSLALDKHRRLLLGSGLCGLIALALSVGFVPNDAEVNPRRPAPALILDGINIVDVESGAIRKSMRVVIRDGRIASLERAHPRSPPLNRDDRVVNAAGQFLIPGLWDMHVHIDTTESWFFPLSIAAGVTSVRDMGGLLARTQNWKRGAGSGALRPTIIAAGPIVTGAVADTDSRLVRVATPTEGRRAVRTLLASGVDFIKVHDWLRRDAYLAIAGEARWRRAYIAGHLPIEADPADAVKARQRSIEHMGNGWAGLLLFASSDRALVDSLRTWAKKADGPGDLMKRFDARWQQHLASTFSPIRARRLCSTLAQGRVSLTPTTYFSAYLTLMPLDSAVVSDERLQYLPQPIREMTQFVVSPERFSPEAKNSPSVDVYKARAQLLRICRDEGVQILAGTDTGPYGPMIPGFSLHDELVRLVADGLSPLESLRAATINPARFFHALDTIGTISVGKRADLVLLDANPLDDIDNIRRIHSVVVGGLWVAREERRRMLETLVQTYR